MAAVPIAVAAAAAVTLTFTLFGNRRAHLISGNGATFIREQKRRVVRLLSRKIRSQGFHLFLRGFYALFALKTGFFNLFGSGGAGRFGVALFPFFQHDTFKFFFFVEKVRDVKKGVAFEADVHKSGLHTG